MELWQQARSAVLDAAYADQFTTGKHLLFGTQNHPTLLEPSIPLAGVCLYLLLKDLLNRLCATLATTGKSNAFKRLALLHNVLLCTYSGWTSFNVWTLTFKHARSHGWEHVYCEHALWEDGLAFWGMLFYLSKYWELVDTMLLIIKRRKPSFLQVYHHAVTIVCAYLLQTSHSAVMFLFVGLNATVHTVMYAYYALTVLGVPVRGKSLITVMQMVQFCVGNALALPSFFLRRGACTCQSQKIAVAAIMAHAVVLTLLFARFYRRAYQGGASPSQKAKDKVKST